VGEGSTQESTQVRIYSSNYDARTQAFAQTSGKKWRAVVISGCRSRKSTFTALVLGTTASPALDYDVLYNATAAVVSTRCMSGAGVRSDQMPVRR